VYIPTTPLLLPTGKEENPSERRMRWGWETGHLLEEDEGKAKKIHSPHDEISLYVILTDAGRMTTVAITAET
jgi:hypothetical protein